MPLIQLAGDSLSAAALPAANNTCCCTGAMPAVGLGALQLIDSAQLLPGQTP